DGRIRTSGPPPEVLTEEHLEAAFGGDVEVTADPATGTPTVSVFEDGPPERATDVTVPLD
ncbi:MAG: ABC transporter, partial [Halobacteriales archaeon]